MRYEIKNQSVTFYLDNPKRTAETTTTQSFVGTGLSEQQVIPILDSVVKKYRGRSLGGQQDVTSTFLRPLFACFQSSRISWPKTSSDWQLFVLRFFQFYLADTIWCQAGTQVRMSKWSTAIVGLLGFLVEEEIIPHDVRIPKIVHKKLQSLAKDRQMLGQSRASPAYIKTQPQKLLVDISFKMNDADFLDAVEKQCRHLVSVIRETCLAHWDGLMQDVETGRQLAAQITDAEIDGLNATGRYSIPHSRNGTPIRYGSPRHPQGHAWALAFVRRTLAVGTDISCISTNTLRSSPFFPKRLLCSHSTKDSYTAFDALTAMGQEQWQVLPIPARFYRFAGLISNIDAAAVCCLLTIEHPSFTSESLRDAKLLNVRGKSYLMLSDRKDLSIYSLNKPRAGKRKTVVLTSVSQKLITDILRCTAPAREVLRKAGDKTWRYLFLGVARHNGATGFLGTVEAIPTYLTGATRTIALTTLYPALEQNGLTKGSFDYRRLRNTLGVIRWFETGSIVEMSRILGNTHKVALENYLPPALLHAWNTRIIRRFQNTLIVLAAHDEPYLLEVTDFSQMADLQQFIAQLIIDYPAKTSPLGDEVQRRLCSEKQRKAVSSASMPGLLNVRLSPKSLGFLYSYADLALSTLAAEELDKVDILSGLAPRQFTDIATLLRHAAESEKLHASLSELLDVPLLKQVHGQALAIQAGLDTQFAKLALKHRWVERS